MQAVSCNLKLKFFLYFSSGLCGSINPHLSAAQTTNLLNCFWSWLQRGYCFYFCHGLSRLCHSRAESELRHLIKSILSQQHTHRKSISGHWKKQLYSCRLYIYDSTITTCICMGIGTYLHTGSNKLKSLTVPSSPHTIYFILKFYQDLRWQLCILREIQHTETRHQALDAYPWVSL